MSPNLLSQSLHPICSTVSVVSSDKDIGGNFGDGLRGDWRRKWQPHSVFLPGKFHGQRSRCAAVHGGVKSWTRLESACAHTLCGGKDPGLSTLYCLREDGVLFYLLSLMQVI